MSINNINIINKFSVHHVKELYTIVISGIAKEQYPKISGEYKLISGENWKNGATLVYEQDFDFFKDGDRFYNYFLHRDTIGNWYVTRSDRYKAKDYSNLIETEPLLKNLNEADVDLAPQDGWSFVVKGAHESHWIETLSTSTISVVPGKGNNFMNIIDRYHSFVSQNIHFS